MVPKLLASLITACLLAGCGSSAGASFEPSGACTSDGQRAGAYPDLEAMIPASFRGVAPVRLDSGRNCSETSLGTLSAHGIRELRFAGGLWEVGERSGVTIAVFRADGLTTSNLAEFYETGARSARKTDAITTGDYAENGVAGRRLDTLNDESFQTILAFDGPQPGTVRAVLVASDVREVGTREAHEDVVAEAANAALSP